MLKRIEARINAWLLRNRMQQIEKLVNLAPFSESEAQMLIAAISKKSPVFTIVYWTPAQKQLKRYLAGTAFRLHGLN